MREIKEIDATGEYVVLKIVVKEEGDDMYKKNKSGLLIPNQDSAPTANTGSGKLQLDHALVYKIGPKVDDDSFKVGDKVVFNDYDIKYVGSKENMFGITKASSIMATYEPGEEVEE